MVQLIYTIFRQNGVSDNHKFDCVNMGVRNELKQLGKLIEGLDQFGVMFQLAIQNNDVIYRSFYGGLVSCLIYITSAVYFAYMFYVWQTNQILPSVNQQIKVPQSMSFNFSDTPFLFSLHIDKPSQELRDLERNNQYFSVKGTVYGKDLSINPISANTTHDDCRMVKEMTDFYDPICQKMDDPVQTWLYQQETGSSDVYLQYSIQLCNPEEQINCLSDKAREEFIQAGAYWRLTTFIEDIDLQTGEVNRIPSEYYFQIHSEDSKSLSVQLKVTKATVRIDDGLILPNYRMVDIVKDIKYLISDEPPIAFQGPQLMISLEKYYYEIEIGYLKLGDLLANLVSVIQSLFLCGFLLSKLNRGLMNDKVKESLLSLYFPQFKQYNFKKDWRNRVKSVEFNNEPLEGPLLNKVLDVQQTLMARMQHKLNHLHILYEINKLQIGFQMILPRKHIKLIQSLNYSLTALPTPDENLFTQSPRKSKSSEILDQRDFLQFQYQKDNPMQAIPLDFDYQRESAKESVGAIYELAMSTIIDNLVVQTQLNTRRNTPLLT